MASLDESAWSTLLASVDDVPAPEEARLVTCCGEKFMVVSSATSLAALDGVKADNMLAARGAPTDFLALGLLRRTVDMATAVGATRRMGAYPSASAVGSGGVGALALVKFITPGAPKTTVDVANVLAQVSLDGLAYQLHAESEIFVLLVEELAKAKAALPLRGVVTFVDLTTKGDLPLWDPAVSTGGRAAVSKLVYDELGRRSWEQRPFRRDSTFRIGEAVLEVNGPILAAAKARLASALSAAGVAETSPQSRAISASAGAGGEGQLWQGDRQQGQKGEAKGCKNNGGEYPLLHPPPVPPADHAWPSKRRRS